MPATPTTHKFITLMKMTDKLYIGEIVVCDEDGKAIACDDCMCNKENGTLGELRLMDNLTYILCRPFIDAYREITNEQVYSVFKK